jgi:hypothetical protein
MKKISKIKLFGERQPRGPIKPLKVSQYSPIKTARNMFNTPWKEVRIMEIAGFEAQGNTFAEQMKSIRKVRLQREVLENPEMARELVKVESTGTYNTRGDIVQAVSTDLGDA